MGRETAWEPSERIPKADSTIRVIICQGKKEGIFYTEGTEKSEEKDNAEAQS